jgi:segregation and condensation protein A
MPPSDLANSLRRRQIARIGQGVEGAGRAFGLQPVGDAVSCGRVEIQVADAAGDEYEPELEVDLFGLIAAFRGVLERANRRPRMVLPPEQMSIEDRIRQLLDRLSETDACGFEDLFADGDGSRPFMIVTFLALLEMIRLKLVRIFQSGGFGPIRVYKRARPADAPYADRPST